MLSHVIRPSSALSVSAGGRWSQLFQNAFVLPYTLARPAAFSLSIPGVLSDIWDSVLKAVPKKKTSHMKKRHRQMAGKALKDVKNLNTCSGCGQVKRAHVLCPHCVESELTDYDGWRSFLTGSLQISRNSGRPKPHKKNAQYRAIEVDERADLSRTIETGVAVVLLGAVLLCVGYAAWHSASGYLLGNFLMFTTSSLCIFVQFKQIQHSPSRLCECNACATYDSVVNLLRGLRLRPSRQVGQVDDLTDNVRRFWSVILSH